jgi:DNA helicase-2/ATP-dependent DNA helicase PcrA
MIEDKQSYLNDLNEAQKKAVLKINGPSMVIAGAGSGKTRVLTYKIVHLIKNGIDPFEILALTFTNKAAREMKSRISSMIGDGESKNIWMGTFHSVFAKILRFEAHKIGYTSDFTIYDVQDSERLISSIIKEMNLDKDSYRPKTIRNRISSLKNSFISVNAYFSNSDLTESDKLSRRSKTGDIYKEYSDRLIKSNSMDFDDLLLKTNELLNNFPEVLAKYQEKFKYILVDEYQDTNNSQYLIVKSLADKYQNICVVGDDAQSIYSFRGANINNIINFRNDYDDVEVYRLEQNYRSTKYIVNAANSVIDNNKNKIHKEVWTDNEFGNKIQITANPSDIAEARLISQKILNLIKSENSYNDFVVLYRTNAQSRVIEDSLRNSSIPYKIYGGVSFYNRKEIKDILAYLRLVVNNNDEESLKRIINYPSRGIGQVTINKIIVGSKDNNLSIYETIKSAKNLNLGLSNSSITKLENFVNQIEVFKIQNKKLSAFEITDFVIKETKIINELRKDESPESIARVENIQELLNGIRDFIDDQKEIADSKNNLSEFLSNVSLATDFDIDLKLSEDFVSLMSLHSSKGLEFKNVFIVGLEEDLFPSALSYNSRDDLEEERRLFYVGITRAKKNLYISYANSRYRWGKLISCEESRFIDEIDNDFIDFKDNNDFSVLQKKSKPSPFIKQKILRQGNFKNLSSVKSNSGFQTKVSVGDKVQHLKFGKGQVIGLEGNNDNVKAKIKFEKIGDKNLLLKFAKLKVL